MTRRKFIKSAALATAASPMLPKLARAQDAAPAKLKGNIHHSVCRWCYKKISLDDLCAAGVDRVLTSGGESTCLQGQETIAQLLRQANRNQAPGRIVIMPGSGIKPGNARQFVDSTGATEIHVGLRSSLPSPMLHRNPRVSMGSVEGREYQRFAVLEEQVRELCLALANPA